MGLFGGGNSSSSTVNNTDNSSDTLTSGQFGSSLIVKGSDNNISMSDQGAIAQAFDFAKGETAATQSMYQKMLLNNQSMYEGALATVSKQSSLLANAYQQGQAPEQVSLKYAGFAVVGLAVAAAAAIAYKKA